MGETEESKCFLYINKYLIQIGKTSVEGALQVGLSAV